MKCPHCEYEHGWSGEEMDVIEGKEGAFFQLSNSIQMERDESSWTPETRNLYGCPSCNKLFMSNGY